MNCIKIEFCAEDRARIDRLIEAMERKTCDKCVADAAAWMQNAMTAISSGAQQVTTTELEASTPADEHPVDDTPWGEPESAPASAPKPPSLEEFQKALTLRCAESEETKAKVRALLHEYAAAASKVPEDKRAEVLERLAKI